MIKIAKKIMLVPLSSMYLHQLFFMWMLGPLQKNLKDQEDWTR